MAATDLDLVQAWIRGRWDRLRREMEPEKAWTCLVAQTVEFVEIDAENVQRILAKMRKRGDL